MALYWAVVIGSWVVTKLPLNLAYRLAALLGELAFVVSSGSRQAILANLSVVLDEPPSSPRVRSIARNVFRHNARNWVDSLRLGSVSKNEIENRVHVDGWADLVDAYAQGAGVLMLGAHVGNIDLVGQLMAARGFDVTVPVETVKPEALFNRTQRLRQTLGIKTIPVENSVRQLLRTLRQGGIVGITVDRRLEPDGLEVLFFGRKTIVSRGPAWLATNGKAPVLVGTGTRNTDGSFHGKVTRLEPLRTGSDSDVIYNAQAIMLAVEERIRAHPEQWCMFTRVWPE